MDMTDKQKAARALGYLEGLSVWLWENLDKVDAAYSESYDKAVETLRKEIECGEGE